MTHDEALKLAFSSVKAVILKNIRKTCKSQKSCSTCPLRTDDGDCIPLGGQTDLAPQTMDTDEIEEALK
jgi:hypothetical protein